MAKNMAKNVAKHVVAWFKGFKSTFFEIFLHFLGPFSGCSIQKQFKKNVETYNSTIFPKLYFSSDFRAMSGSHRAAA